MREIIHFACTKCKRINYSSNKNKKNTKDRILLKKYCPWCRTHSEHKEEK